MPMPFQCRYQLREKWRQTLGADVVGRSGRALAQELGVSPQAVYAAAGRVGRDIRIEAGDLEQWCR